MGSSESTDDRQGVEEFTITAHGAKTYTFRPGDKVVFNEGSKSFREGLEISIQRIIQKSDSEAEFKVLVKPPRDANTEENATGGLRRYDAIAILDFVSNPNAEYVPKNSSGLETEKTELHDF